MTETTTPFAHPETGEALESLIDFQDALTNVESRLAPLYRLRRALRDEMNLRFDPVLPHKRWQSMTQEKVARCPRCQRELEA